MRCSGCGYVWRPAEGRHLKLVGYMACPIDESDSNLAPFELRNCNQENCGSTFCTTVTLPVDSTMWEAAKTNARDGRDSAALRAFTTFEVSGEE